jgi:hypothetical protein
MIVAAMVMAAAKSVWDRMFLPSLRRAMRSGNDAIRGSVHQAVHQQ